MERCIIKRTANYLDGLKEYSKCSLLGTYDCVVICKQIKFYKRKLGIRLVNLK